MPNIIFQIKLNEQPVLRLILRAEDTTGMGAISFKPFDPKYREIADAWREQFLSTPGRTFFRLNAGYTSYEDLVYVLEQLAPPWSFHCENPPPVRHETPFPPYVLH